MKQNLCQLAQGKKLNRRRRLRRTTDELKQANRRKDEFLAMLGNELRNPLAPIRTAVGIMERFGPVEPTLDKARAIRRFSGQG